MDEHDISVDFHDMELKITPELREKVREYHLDQGDKRCRVVRVVRDEKGFPFALVRITDAKGIKRSCIDNVFDYVVEHTSCDRNDEAEMVQAFSIGCW